jgi:hypothetical protein
VVGALRAFASANRWVEATASSIKAGGGRMPWETTETQAMIATKYSLVTQLARLVPAPGKRAGRKPFVSSRTPEGRYGRCPVCREFICIEPSRPCGDAPCPCCGHLIWSIDPLWPVHVEDRPRPPQRGVRAPRRSAPSIRLGEWISRTAGRVRRAIRSAVPAKARQRDPSSSSSPGIWDPWLDG